MSSFRFKNIQQSDADKLLILIEENRKLKAENAALKEERETTISFLRLVQSWLYKHGHEPLWFDEYVELRDRLVPDEEII